MSDQQAPKQIYLQAYESDSYDDNTWCQDKINDEDIEYILQSEYDQLKAENERLREALNNIFLTDVVSFVHAHYRGEYPVEFAVMNLQEIARRALKEVKE